MTKKPNIVKIALSKLALMTCLFYSSLFVGGFLNLDDGILNALESAGTLSLGAYLAIIREKVDDTIETKSDSDPDPEPEPEFEEPFISE